MIRLSPASAVLAILALAACGQKPDEVAKAAPDAVAPAVDAAPATLKHPSPGFWSMKVTAAGQVVSTSRICYDQATAEKVGLLGRTPGMSEGCTDTQTLQPDGSMAFTSTCNGQTITGVMRGDLSKAYTMEFTTQGQATRIETTRLGDCPADYKPGDMEVQGMKINIMEGKT